MAMRWYVVQTYSGFENQVVRSLKERIERNAMEDKFGRVLVPTEEVVEMREGQKRRSERKFFPGYVLVQMELDDETWHLVKDVPKVIGFIGGSSDRPAPISDKEAEAILQRVQEGVEKPRPKVLFEPGEMVRDQRRPVRGFQCRGRRGRLREEPAQGGGADLRPLDAGGAGFRSGRKGLEPPSAPGCGRYRAALSCLRSQTVDDTREPSRR